MKEAQGSVTLEIWGNDEELSKVINILKTVKGNTKETSGLKDSLIECEAICYNCSKHLDVDIKLKSYAK